MKTKLKKYRYLGVVHIEVPQSWESIILNMLSQIDKITRPKFMPLILLNLIYDIMPGILLEFMPNTYITQIKQKFGALRIYGVFSLKAQEIINATEIECNNTCEFCGNPNTTHIMVKSWVRNLCTTCKEAKKYGTNI
jgi:ribosomal protein L37AE/L43A